MTESICICIFLVSTTSRLCAGD